MEFIGLIVIIAWIISKLFGGSNPNNKNGLNTYEKYETFDNIRKVKK